MLKASIGLVITGFALFPAGPRILSASAVPPEPRASRPKTTLKRTWHSGPASTPPQTEIVPTPPPLPSPARSPEVGSEDNQDAPARLEPRAGTSPNPGSDAGSAAVMNTGDNSSPLFPNPCASEMSSNACAMMPMHVEPFMTIFAAR